ncbi:acyltransferase [Bifidobacterium phasiani]|uniref:Acyltransferase n=1 Tax=Bifidobacterium phasiani TaxID=2834431 RepID=A0ABS6WDE6_9BIFI|nr:acyltransferase [Bifidobacterium phasiani]MBW3083762.1 acyltransferase [Bifidobacterium phasiani]
MADTQKAKRDWRFEFMRILAMLGIVAAHYFSSDNWDVHINPERMTSWLSCVHQSMDIFGQVGVTWFALISAYFMAYKVGSPVRRAVHVWVEVFLYSVLIFVFVVALSKIDSSYAGPDPLDRYAMLRSLLPVTFNEYWFIGAYIIMIVLSPFMNMIAEHASYRQFLGLIAVSVWVIFIWRLLNPQIGYFTDYGYLCCVYLIGVLIRRYADRLPKISLLAVTLVTVLSWIVCVVGTHFVRSDNVIATTLGYPPNALGAGGGASPILSVIIGVVSFLWFVQRHSTKTPRRSNVLTRLVVMIAPATLGIYLLHTNGLLVPVLFEPLYAVAEPAGMIGKGFVAIVTILAVFTISLLISLLVHYLVVRPVLGCIDRLGGFKVRQTESRPSRSVEH